MAQRTAGGNAVWHNFHNDYAHIADPNERRRLALAEIDKASFGWYHVRATIVAGIGFFTDAYDIFAIGLVTVMLGVVYFNSAIPASADTAMKVATSGGTVIGQFGFGILADIVGRKKMYGLELIIMISATLAQALSAAAPGITIVGVICFWRVMMGVVSFFHQSPKSDPRFLTVMCSNRVLEATTLYLLSLHPSLLQPNGEVL